MAFAGKVKVPVEVSMGPAVHRVSGGVAAERPVMGGLVMDVEAVITKRWIKKNKRKIPKKYRSHLRDVDELRIHPLGWLPDTLYLTPERDSVGMWGASWRPVAFSFPLSKGTIKLRATVGLRVALAWIPSESLGNTTFARPGLDPRLEGEVKLAKHWRLSASWTSQVYVPQAIGGAVGELGGPGERIWHVGQGAVRLRYRFPYETHI